MCAPPYARVQVVPAAPCGRWFHGIRAKSMAMPHVSVTAEKASRPDKRRQRAEPRMDHPGQHDTEQHRGASHHTNLSFQGPCTRRATLDRIAGRGPGLHAACHNADIQVPALLNRSARAWRASPSGTATLPGVKPCGLGSNVESGTSRASARRRRIRRVRAINHLARVVLDEASAQGVNGRVWDGLRHGWLLLMRRSGDRGLARMPPLSYNQLQE